MILNQNRSVSIFSEDDEDKDKDVIATEPSAVNDNTGLTSIKFSTGNDESEPPAKKKCVDKQIVSKLCIVVETANASEKFLNNIKTQSWLLDETIINGGLQVTKNEGLCEWLITTFGVTSRKPVAIFLYDPEKDILLENLDVLPLWENDGTSHCVSSIIEILMLLNFTVFTNPNVADEFILRKSKFQTYAGKYFARYWESEGESSFSSFETELYIDNATQYIRRFGVRCKER